MKVKRSHCFLYLNAAAAVGASIVFHVRPSKRAERACVCSFPMRVKTSLLTRHPTPCRARRFIKEKRRRKGSEDNHSLFRLLSLGENRMRDGRSLSLFETGHHHHELELIWICSFPPFGRERANSISGLVETPVVSRTRKKRGASVSPIS